MYVYIITKNKSLKEFSNSIDNKSSSNGTISK